MNSVGLVPLRRRDQGVEILWSQRPDTKNWFGGFWGVPVGRMVKDDAAVPVEQREYPLPLYPGVYGCAAREMFEELGCLPVDGEIVPGESVGLDPALRRDIEGDPDSFAASLRRAELQVDPDVLQSVGDWKTPPWFPTEFSTEFVACPVTRPVSRRMLNRIDGDEHLNARWITPKKAHEEWSSGAAFITTPVRLLLEALIDGDRWLWENETILVTADWFESESARAASSRPDIEITRGIRWLGLPSQTITATNRTNCWLVGTDQVAVIDPGTPYSRPRRWLAGTLESLRASGLAVGPVLLTHHHDDHAAAARWLADRFDMDIFCHPRTAEELSETSRVAGTLDEGSKVELGNSQRIESLHTPGHAPGHLAYCLKPQGHVVSGDLVMRGSTVLIDPSEGDMGAYLESLRRLRDERPASVLPGHGHPIRDIDWIVEAYLGHRERRERQILQALRRRCSSTGASVSPAELVPEVYADAPRRRWPMAMRSLESHLIHLVERGEAERIGEESLYCAAARSGVESD